jgi:3-hydroxyisobutyrate dehydrogenase
MKICWIGTGVMGSSMLEHLIDAGHKCTVYTRTKEKALPLLAKGAIWADSPAAAAEGANFAGMIVGMPSDVEQVTLGENGLLKNMSSGTTLVDFTTSSPALAVKIANFAKTINVNVLDAPVSGGDTGAKNATLSIMVGGERAVFDNAMPILKLLGKTIEYQGSAGSGQHTKMVNQILIAGTMIGLCEALIYAKKSGLNPLQVLKSVGGGAAASWSLTNLAPRIIAEDFEPGFYVEHFIKDMGIALTESQNMNIELPGLKLVHSLYQKLQNEMNMGKNGTQALIKVLM